MTRFARAAALAAAAALVAVAGCKEDKVDNSKNQTPNDAPIGAPQSVGAGPGAVKGREAPLKQ